MITKNSVKIKSTLSEITLQTGEPVLKVVIMNPNSNYLTKNSFPLNTKIVELFIQKSGSFALKLDGQLKINFAKYPFRLFGKKLIPGKEGDQALKYSRSLYKNGICCKEKTKC